MTTYLLTWNPAHWHWADLQECTEDVKKHGFHEDRWSCGSSKRIITGDRVFLLRQGQEPRGIVGSGWAITDVYEDEHWDQSKRARNQPARYIGVRFDVLLDPDNEPVYSRRLLDHGVLQAMHWDTQMSGIRIPHGIATELETEWARFLASSGIVQLHIISRSIVAPEEVLEAQTYPEGATTQITVNAYERNPEARRQCIRHYGLDCQVCGCNFENVYGDVGIGLIHVHHLTPLTETRAEYEVDPVADLRPVCPNCHAIIHRRTPPYSIEEVRSSIGRRVPSPAAKTGWDDAL